MTSLLLLGWRTRQLKSLATKHLQNEQKNGQRMSPILKKRTLFVISLMVSLTNLGSKHGSHCAFRIIPIRSCGKDSRSVCLLTQSMAAFIKPGLRSWIPRGDWGCASDPSGRSVSIHNAAYETDWLRDAGQRVMIVHSWIYRGVRYAEGNRQIKDHSYVCETSLWDEVSSVPVLQHPPSRKKIKLESESFEGYNKVGYIGYSVVDIWCK